MASSFLSHLNHEVKKIAEAERRALEAARQFEAQQELDRANKRKAVIESKVANFLKNGLRQGIPIVVYGRCQYYTQHSVVVDIPFDHETMSDFVDELKKQMKQLDPTFRFEFKRHAHFGDKWTEYIKDMYGDETPFWRVKRDETTCDFVFWNEQ